MAVLLGKFFFVGALAFVLQQMVQCRFRDHWNAIFVWKVCPRCEYCKSWTGLQLESSHTMYNFDGEWFDPKNPNRPVFLCRCCAEQHEEFWDEQWRDYYNSR